MTGGTLADRVRDLRSADRRGFDLIGQFTLRCRRTGAGSYPATTSPSEVRGAIVPQCLSGRSRLWPRIRAKQALAPTGPIPLSGGTWREVEAILRPHFPLVPISPFPAGCARPGEHASGQPDRRPAAGSLGAPRPVAWAARLSRVAWPAEALPSGCPGHPLRRGETAAQAARLA